MKWIILSHDRPAQLQAVLESAQEYLPSVIPFVCFGCSSDEAFQGYSRVAGQLRASWHGWSGDGAFRPNVLDLVNRINQNRNLEAMTLLTTDNMVFHRKTNSADAWSLLNDPNVLGVSLIRSPDIGGLRMSKVWGRKRLSGATWNWPGLSDWWGEGFSFGTVYRTSDLLGTLSRNQWDSPETLREAACDDPVMRRRARMACLPDAPMMVLPMAAAQ